jgi:hypothetical protein
MRASAWQDCLQDAAQQQHQTPGKQPLRAVKPLTGDRLMQFGAGLDSAAAAAPVLDDVPDLAAGGELGALPGASPTLAAPQRGYCVSSRCPQGEIVQLPHFARLHTHALTARVVSTAVRLVGQQIVFVCVFHTHVCRCKRLFIGLQSDRSSRGVPAGHAAAARQRLCTSRAVLCGSAPRLWRRQLAGGLETARLMLACC